MHAPLTSSAALFQTAPPLSLSGTLIESDHIPKSIKTKEKINDNIIAPPTITAQAQPN